MVGYLSDVSKDSIQSFSCCSEDTDNEQKSQDDHFIYIDRYQQWRLVDHPIFAPSCRPPNICQDLLMLENQLPFFILARVFSILTNNPENSLIELAIKLFRQVHFGKLTVMAKFNPEQNPKHLLDLFHSSAVSLKWTKESSRTTHHQFLEWKQSTG